MGRREEGRGGGSQSIASHGVKRRGSGEGRHTVVHSTEAGEEEGIWEWVPQEGAGLLSFVGCLTFQQHASVSQGRICSDKCTCYQAEIEVADQTFYLTQSQYTDTRQTSPSNDPKTPGAGLGNHWSTSF